MKKLTAVVALVLCLALLSTGCTMFTKQVTFKEYYKDKTYEDPAPLLNKMEEITVLKGMSYLRGFSDLLVMEEQNDDVSMYVFYSRNAESTVWKLDKSTVGEIRYFTVNGNTFVLTGAPVVEENGSAGVSKGSFTYALYHMDPALRNELFMAEFGASWKEVSPDMEEWPAEDVEGFAQYLFESNGIDPLACLEGQPVDSEEQDAQEEIPAYSLYNAAGNLIASSNSDGSIDDVYDYAADLLAFGGVIYRVAEDGTLSEVVSAPFFGDIPEIDYKTDSYYFTLDEDGAVSVYDLSLNTVMYWELPRTEIEEFTIVPVGGNIFVQVFTPLLAFEDHYDVMLEENEEGKYDIDTYIINPKTGKVTSADVDFVILSTDAQYSGKEWNSQYANIARIENKRILDAQSKLEYVSLNKNTGKVEAIILSDLYGTATQLTENRFLYQTYNGDCYLMDKEGNNLGKINKLSNLASTGRNQNYIVLDGKLYNYDLQETFDFNEAELSVRKVMGHSVLFADKENTFSLFTKNGEMKKLALAKEAVLEYSNNQLFVIRDADRMSIFNEEGTQLGKIKDATDFDFQYSTTGEAILTAYFAEEDGTVNYRHYKLTYVAAE